MTAFPFDDIYLGPGWHDRPDDLGPSDADCDDFDINEYLRDETPDDRRTLIALMWRRERMATR